MARVKAPSSNEPIREIRPALTPDAREKQMIALAVDEAEKRLLNGTASPQIIVHYLRLGTEKERLERERLALENKLVQAKTEAIESDRRSEELYLNAINAMKRYSGHGGESYDEDSDLF